MIRYDNAIRKQLTPMSKLVTFGKSTKLNWTKPETNYNGICHIIPSSTRISRRKSEECAMRQPSIKVWHSTINSLWTRPATKSGRNYFLIPRTSNSAISWHRSDVHSGISAEWNNAKTDLCNRRMPGSTHQTHDDSEVRTSSRSLRSSSKEADTERTWRRENRQSLSLDWFINGAAVAIISSQEATSVCCKRAAEILESSSMDQWRHVKGIENPADIGTRGMSIEDLKESVCLNGPGPAWLHTDEEKWPKPWCQANKFEAEQATSTVAAETKLHQTFDWDRYSSLNRIRNFIAYYMRFKTKQKGPLKADEVLGAEQTLLRFVQAESFPNVSKSITNSKEISKTFNIAKLSPFIEEVGTIWVKGRLKRSNLDYNAKHPILLTAKHPLVQTLLERAHRDNLHEGTEYVRNMLQQEYWIIGLRNALRKLKSKCIKCRHRNAKPIHPPMVDLPRERLDEHVFPFTHTGVDYFGPIEVKILRRTLKRWCCLFTCLTTRAVHIEVAQSLDTESCLAAVTRFIARRGYPSAIISDNGTNFVGAAKELKAFMDEWDRAKVESDLAQKKIIWRFNPPGAPHFGGIWKRLDQSCKNVIIAILDHRSLTDEVLSTTMCLVEQTLNARPLTAVSDDLEDLTALTPNHFLRGQESASAPFMLSSERYHDLKKSFKTAQSYADMMWKRWTREYLPQWNQRSKWSKEHVRNLKEG